MIVTKSSTGFERMMIVSKWVTVFEASYASPQRLQSETWAFEDQHFLGPHLGRRDRVAVKGSEKKSQRRREIERTLTSKRDWPPGPVMLERPKQPTMSGIPSLDPSMVVSD